MNELPFGGDAPFGYGTLPLRKTFARKKKPKPKTTTTTRRMPATMRRARNFVLGVGGTMTLLTLLGGFFPASSSPALDATTSWLATNWVFVHGAYGIVAILLLLSSPKPKSCDWMAMLLSAAYCSHQWEEHGWDILGRRYSFVDHLAKLLSCELTVESYFPRIRLMSSDCGFDERTILYINTYAVMGLFLAPLILPTNWRAYKRAMVIFNAMLVLVNALLFHLVPALVFQEYNPGLVQSVMVNAPLSFWVLRSLHQERHRGDRTLFALAFLINGFPGQAVQALGPMVLARRGLIDGFQLHAIQAWTFLTLQPALPFLLEVDQGKKKGKKIYTRKVK